MITEHAILNVIPGQEDDFLSDLERAKTFIAGSPGFRRAPGRTLPGEPQHFLLLVEWESLEAHTEGFRGSAAYEEWRSLLHHFYDPFPVVEHFEPVATA